MVSAIVERRDVNEISIPASIEEKIKERLDQVQMLPSIAQQALELVRDPDCSIKEFVRIVEQDLKLATEMLRIANSVVYSQGRPIASLNEAAVRLGLNPCKNLILTSCFASLIGSLPVQDRWVREQLGQHGLVTAVIATNVGKALKIGCQGEEFTAGLVHDIGRIILAVAIPEDFLAADAVDFQEVLPQQLKQEQQTWGTTHTEVGAWFAAQNRLPDCLVSAIRFHHFPTRAPRDHRKLTTLVAIADDMANHVQRHQTGEGYDPEFNSAIDQLAELGVDRPREKLIAASRAILETSCQDALELCGK